MNVAELFRVYRMRVLAVTLSAAALAGCGGGGQAYNYVHLPGTEPAAGANMPFTSAIQVRNGNILFCLQLLFFKILQLFAIGVAMKPLIPPLLHERS